MDLVWKMLEGGATVIENIIIYDFYSKFFGYKRESVYNKAIILVFLVITSLCSIAITELFSFSGYATYLCIGIIVLYGFIFLKGNTVFKTVIPIILFSTILIINMLSVFAYSIVFSVDTTELFESQSLDRLFLLILTKLLFLIAVKGILTILKREANLTNTQWFLFLGIFLMTLSIGVIIVEMDGGTHIHATASSVLLFVEILAINVFVFCMLFRISKQNQKVMRMTLLELQLSQQRKTIEDIDLLHYRLRKIHHDTVNHLLTLREMMRENKTTEAEQYIDKILDQNPITPVIHIEIPNNYLQALLTVKMEQCKIYKIPCSIRADNSSPTCEPVDLCVLVSNIMDNAIEASRNTPDPRIELMLSQKENYYRIEVRNKITGSVLQKNADLKTTKTDSSLHGFGLQNVREIVERNDGMMEYYESGQWFIVQVLLKQVPGNQG